MSVRKAYQATCPSRVNNRSSSPFDLVWGPYCVTFLSGFWYILVFVDDHSRTPWVYLFKDRTRVYDAIKEII